MDPARKRFGEILIEAGVLDAETLARALVLQRSTRQRLGKVLEEMHVISEREIAAVLARQFGFRTARQLASRHFPSEVLALVSAEQVRRFQVFPLKLQHRNLLLAMVNPLDLEVIDAIAFQSGLRVIPCVTTPSEILQAAARHYPAAAPPEEPALPPPGVLLIDADERTRRAHAAALASAGCQVLEARSGGEGLTVVRHAPPRLILLDTLLPDMDGLTFARQLQQSAATRQIPLIAFSLNASVEEEARCLDAGFIDVLAKPVHPLRLRARVARVLRLFAPSA